MTDAGGKTFFAPAERVKSETVIDSDRSKIDPEAEGGVPKSVEDVDSGTAENIEEDLEDADKETQKLIQYFLRKLNREDISLLDRRDGSLGMDMWRFGHRLDTVLADAALVFIIPEEKADEIEKLAHEPITQGTIAASARFGRKISKLNPDFVKAAGHGFTIPYTVTGADGRQKEIDIVFLTNAPKREQEE